MIDMLKMARYIVLTHANWKDCPQCYGKGEVKQDRRGIDGNECDMCGGVGKVEIQE